MDQTVWFARHGSRQDEDPAWLKTATRPHDPGLSAEGHRQARCVAERLVREGLRHIFTSPFLRAVETAHFIAQATDLPVKVEPGLCEWLNAEFFHTNPETLPVVELARRYPEIDLKYVAVMTPQYPEDIRQIHARTGHTARKLAATYREPILMIGHGASIGGALLGLFPEAGIIYRGSATCGLHQLVLQGGTWKLSLHNETAHLAINKTQKQGTQK